MSVDKISYQANNNLEKIYDASKILILCGIYGHIIDIQNFTKTATILIAQPYIQSHPVLCGTRAREGIKDQRP